MADQDSLKIFKNIYLEIYIQKVNVLFPLVIIYKVRKISEQISELMQITAEMYALTFVGSSSGCTAKKKVKIPCL